MKRSYIAIIDSGVGGLSVLYKIKKVLPNENFLYLGDNKNAPYGNKSINELKKIVFNNIILLNSYNIKFLVVACNTLSTNLSFFIKSISSYPVYFIYPPVEKYLIENKSIILLSTIATSNIYSESNNLEKLPQKDLALFIEENIFNLNNIKTYEFIKKCFYRPDLLILGCTHYFFINNKFFDHFNYKHIICSEDLLVFRLQKEYKCSKSLVKHKRFKILFIGENKKFNCLVWKKVVKNIEKS